MTETLLLRPSCHAEDRFDSVVLDRDARIIAQSTAEGRESIEAAANGRKVVGLIPGGDVLLTSVRLPPMAASKLRQGIAYALEDQLIEDLEAQHFALGDRLGEEQAVAVIARRRLQYWLDRFAAVGIAPRALHADASCIAPKPGDLLVWIDGDEARIVPPEGRAEYAPIALLEETLRAHLAAESASSLGIWIYATASDLEQHSDVIEALRSDAVPLHVHVLQNGPLPWLGTHWSIGRPINLLQAEYAPRATVNLAWLRWRWAASLAALLLIAHLGSRELEWARLQQLERDVDAQLLNQAAAVAPGVASADAAAAILRRQLQRLQAGGAADPRALRELEWLALARGQIADIRVQSLQQQADGTVVVIRAGTTEVAEAYAEALRGAGVALQPIEIRSTESGVEATLRWPVQRGAQRT
jgi:general secretion pathway protein L